MARYRAGTERGVDRVPSAAAALRIKPEPDPRLSRSLEYGLTALECFTTDTPTLGIAQLAERIGVGRSTAHRYAMTLLTLGYLEQDARRKYRLAGGAVEPGMAALGAIRRRTAAYEPLAELRDRTGHTVGLGVLDGTRALYVLRLLGHRAGQYETDRGLGAGVSLPLHCSALGKALLASRPGDERDAIVARLRLARRGPRAIRSKPRLSAELESVRACGYAIDDEELARGSRAIAVALPHRRERDDGRLDRHGVERLDERDEARVLAIDLVAPAATTSAAQLAAQVAPLLRQAADALLGS